MQRSLKPVRRRNPQVSGVSLLHTVVVTTKKLPSIISVAPKQRYFAGSFQVGKMLRSSSSPPPPVATSYQLVIAGDGVVNAPVTLTYTPNGPSTATITPHDPGVAGVFSPTVVSFNGNGSVVQTWTPSELGMASFASSNNEGLTDPDVVVYVVNGLTMVVRFAVTGAGRY